MKINICIILLIMIFGNSIFTLDLNAQLMTNAPFNSTFQVGVGIITTQILGDNPATLPMISSADVANAVTGGSFTMSQPGIQLRFTLPLDNNIRIPFSIDYTFFRGKERMNYNRNIVDYFSHSLDVIGINTGIQYAFLSIPIVRAKIYTGIEARLSKIRKVDIEWYRDYLNFPDEIYKYDTKPEAWRLGGSLILGAEGRLIDRWFINFGGSLMVTNFIGRDDSRGELLTPITMFESKESFVSNLQIFILIQYHF
jgi:hypothetical protein